MALYMRRRVVAGVTLAGLIILLIIGVKAVLSPSVHALLRKTDTPSGFGFTSASASFTKAGEPVTQAGSHPDLTLAFELNKALDGGGEPEVAGGEARNLTVNLPPGLVANATAVAQCPRQLLDGSVGGGPGAQFACPADTEVGVDTAHLIGGGGELDLVNIPVYNMVPPPGVPAEFAFQLEEIEVFIDGGVRSGGDYGLVGHVDNIAQRGILRSTVTLFGEPEGKPFLTLPTSCEGPLQFSLEANTWSESHAFATAEFEVPAVTGCERLTHFSPSITTAPDTSDADTPAGLTVDVRVPQDLNPEGLATAGIKDTTVTLPEGLVINPGQAAGLEACQVSQEALGGPADDGPPECPVASKVGSVEIETPLLKDVLKGSVYVLQSNPPHLQLLVAASADGVNVKLVGNVHLDPVTGRLTTTFNGNTAREEGTPNLPFTEFRLSFSGGPQAALATPTACGAYTTTADFTPWSTPLIPDVFPTSTFLISSGPGGSPCVSPRPFAPSMIAGSTTDQAGGETGFSLLLRNADGQQRISGLQFKFPPGLLGRISKVTPCPEPQASQGQCSPASKIGHTIVASGPGPFPLIVPEPGQPEAQIYLTGPYKGAPFGLVIVVPVIAGPFDLGTEIVRSRIEVDPHTAQVTITTDPLPQIIKGVPTDLRTINAIADLPGFIINPTNCNAMTFTGTATSAEGATAPLSTPFHVGSCQSLKFTPHFEVSTTAKTSRANGASLTTTLTYPESPSGTSPQANIARVKVELPKQLPSRLKTLQKACLAAIFNTNPANCPTASIVGHAKVITPVLPVPLTGPAYFVSHGNEAFPSLIIVLQGDNVTADIEASTFISKKGITSSTFKTVPDVPFNTFTLTLPTGPYSALAANSNLCTTNLTMPTEFTAQNGAEIHQHTKIKVTSCPRHTTKHKTKTKHANKHKTTHTTHHTKH